VSKGAALTKLNRTEDSIQAFDQMLSKFTSAVEPSLKAEVARALQNKAGALTTLGRSEEEIESYNSTQEQLNQVVAAKVDPRSWSR